LRKVTVLILSLGLAPKLISILLSWTTKGETRQFINISNRPKHVILSMYLQNIFSCCTNVYRWAETA
jgi:hypothetical protein